MARRVLRCGVLAFFSLAFVAASVQAGGPEIWQLEQRVRWTTNKGEHGTETYEGELWVAASGYTATNVSSKGSAFLWDGAFTAANQPWRDSSVKVNHLVFDAVTPGGGVVVGDLRPNKKWTRLTGKIIATVPSGVDPSLSYYYEITVTATRP